MRGIAKTLFVVCVVVLLSACTTTRYVPVERVRIDSVVQCVERVDTLIERDSVFVRQSADSVFVTRYKTLYKVRERIDTISITQRDTIAVPYEVVRELPMWERTKIELAGVAFGILLCIVCVATIAIMRKFKK